MTLVKSFDVEEEMRKNPKLNKSDLEMLRDWLKKQPHLPPISDFELVLFLHSNYYRIQPTKTTIDTFFTVRTHVPEFFSERDPLLVKELRKTMEIICCIPLPGSTPDGYKVMFTKVIDSDPSRYVFVNALKLFCMCMELWLYTSGTIPGFIIFFDMNDVVFGHVARLSPMIAKKMCYYLEEGLPTRLKGLHFVNAVPFIDLIVNIAKPFMKNELKDVFFIHTSPQTVKEIVPIDLLPNDQGGKAGSLKDLWAAEITKLEKHRSWFQEEEMRKVNEAARPDKTKNVTDIFGVEGSFKKLDID